MYSGVRADHGERREQLLSRGVTTAMAEQRAHDQWNAEPVNPGQERRSIARRGFPFLAAAAAVAACVWIASLFFDRYTHLYIDDARVGADVISIASRVPGWIVEFNVGATDVVEKGDLLVSLDAREAATTVAEIEARLKGILT